MNAWNDLVELVARNSGVGTPALARQAGVSESTWHRRTRAEGWKMPYRGVRVAPWAPGGPRTRVTAFLGACGPGAAASGRTAAWLQELGPPPTRFDAVVPYRRAHPRVPRHRVRRTRWLEPEDVVEVGGVPCLTVEATVLSRSLDPDMAVRGYVIDALHQGRTTLDQLTSRFAAAGPIAGRGNLAALLAELSDRSPESVFHDLVLTAMLDRGYPAARAPERVATPDGRGVMVDIALMPFKVAVEPAGDRYHRDRSARRNDRRRSSQLAGTPWAVVTIDWQDWHEREGWVWATIDAAILEQHRRGLGSRADLPPHLRDHRP